MTETMVMGTIAAIEDRASGLRVFINTAEGMVCADESYEDAAAMGLYIGGTVDVMEVRNEQAEPEYSIQSQLN